MSKTFTPHIEASVKVDGQETFYVSFPLPDLINEPWEAYDAIRNKLSTGLIEHLKRIAPKG